MAGQQQRPGGAGQPSNGRARLQYDTRAVKGLRQVCEQQTAGSPARLSAWPLWHRLLAAVLLAAGSAHAAPALADAELARAKNCMACHAMDKKLIGPSYKDVALKYASDRNAAAKLAKKVREGSVGVWGQIPMPANPQDSPDEATRLVNWLLGQK